MARRSVVARRSVEAGSTESSHGQGDENVEDREFNAQLERAIAGNFDYSMLEYEWNIHLILQLHLLHSRHKGSLRRWKWERIP